MKLSHKAAIAAALAVAFGSTVMLAGFGPASWEGRKRYNLDGAIRETLAERLKNGEWAVSCYEDTVPCDLRAEAVCGGSFRTLSETTSDHDRKRFPAHRGMPAEEGGSKYTRVFQCVPDGSTQAQARGEAKE